MTIEENSFWGSKKWNSENFHLTFADLIMVLGCMSSKRAGRLCCKWEYEFRKCVSVLEGQFGDNNAIIMDDNA